MLPLPTRILVGTADFAQQEWDDRPQRGLGWVVARGVDKEVGHFVDAALMLSDAVQDATKDSKGFGHSRAYREFECLFVGLLGVGGVTGEQ